MTSFVLSHFCRILLHLSNFLDVDQALNYWIDSTRLRMMMSETLDKIAAKKLKEIRPYPNNFAMVANTRNMNRLFKIVINPLTTL